MEPRDYGPFPYIPINDRPILKWPNGARLAVWIVPNIEFFPLSIGIPGSPYDSRVPAAPTVRAWAQRDYGNRVGIWRMMEVLAKAQDPRLRQPQQRHLRPPSADRKGRGRTRLGDPRPQRNQFALA